MHGMNRAQLVLARFDAAEYRVCRGLNRAAGHRWFRQLMRLASRLGDVGAISERSEVLVDGRRSRLVRKRETIRDLLAPERT